MPTDELDGFRFLDDVGHVIEHDVRPKYRLHNINQRRMGGKFQRRFQHGVYLAVIVQVMSHFALRTLEVPPMVGSLLWADHGNRTHKTVIPVCLRVFL